MHKRVGFIFSIIVVILLFGGFANPAVRYYVKNILLNPEKTTVEVTPLLEYYPVIGNEAEAKAVVVVIHGQNQKPSAMNMFVNDLQENKFEVFRVGLSGHRGDFENMKHATRNMWMKDMLEVYTITKARAEELQKPLRLLAFSHGALVAYDFACEMGLAWDRAFVLAPAFAIRTPSWLIDFVGTFTSSFTFRSSIPVEYRANDQGSVSSVIALNDSLKHLESCAKKEGSILSKIPTKIMMDPDDELVSSRGIKSFIEDLNLNWEFEPNISVKNNERGYEIHHLVIDQASLGLQEWTRVKTAARTWLD